MIKDRRITYDRICDIMDEVEDKVSANKAIDIETLFDVLYILNEKREQTEEKDGDADKIVINIDKKALDDAMQTILEAIANAHVNGRVYEETKESSEYAIKLAKAMAHIMSGEEPEFNDGEEEDNE